MATSATPTRPPLPPFTRESAIEKVRLAEDGWNTRDPEKVTFAYAIDSRWRNRAEFINGRKEIIEFLTRKWTANSNTGSSRNSGRSPAIGSRCGSRTNGTTTPVIGNRSYGNENWEFNDDGLMRSRFASINDLPILEPDRKYHWALGRRPDGHPGLSDLGF